MRPDQLPSPTDRRQRLERGLRARLPRQPDLVLVTDLDGTLLGGSPRWRRRLYRWLTDRRDSVLHVFNTGRDLASIARLLEEESAMGMGSPHLVISDVGCTVACGVSLAPIPRVVDPIERRWRGQPERVLPLLRTIPGLSAQPVSTVRRLAYLIDPTRLDRSRLGAVAAQGVDCLISGDKYLDVLPAGVNKGSTLTALIEWLEVTPESVVTAGDSLNDLAMFETGLQGVMVGNAEPALVEALPRLRCTYRAKAHGCAGIVEGLRHFGYGPLLAGHF
ncbi:MAG: HAD family hydrolase [Cyanobacteriota bacterium]|jgi:predicted mannosyl-3-phosphoglycerate phosphatase (HAD superfamily)